MLNQAWVISTPIELETRYDSQQSGRNWQPLGHLVACRANGPQPEDGRADPEKQASDLFFTAGAPIQIKASKTMRFSAGQGLKESL